jgi:type I site-specific restriction endonuclease
MGRRKSDGNHPHKKNNNNNNLIQDSEGSEENGYLVPDPNKTKLNDIKESSDAQKNTFKEEILQEITENFIEKILNMVIQNVQDALKKFQDIKNKEYKKTQKQINELIGALNKHQSEAENTINREINELKLKIQNVKEEITQDMKNLRKKNQTETQNTVEGHSTRPEQVEDRSSELKDKT